jgi:hypothetical protein
VQINGGETPTGIQEPERGALQIYRRRPGDVGRVSPARELSGMNQPDHRRSLAAERMRRHRERRRDGLRCLIIELRETEIDALIRRGLLNGEARNDPGAIIDALYAFLDDMLDATP